MSVTKGRDGVVEMDLGTGDVAIAEVISFTYSDTAEQIEVKAMGDTFKRSEDGLREANGQIVLNYDQTDTSGQHKTANLYPGANVGLKLYPSGKDSGDAYLTSVGNDYNDQVKILSEELSAEVDGIVGRTFNYQGGLLWDNLP